MTKISFKLHPSDIIPLRLYGAIKVNKPEKTTQLEQSIGTVTQGTSKYLVNIIQLILNKNEHRVNTSTLFTNKAKTLQIIQDKIQAFSDVINLHSSIPIDNSVTVVIDTLNN